MPIGLGSEPRVDPETQVIRLLHLGKAWYRGNAPGPIFLQDPKIDWLPVPACRAHGDDMKALRIFLPRTRDALLQKFDVVLIDGMDAYDLRPKFQQWLVEGMETLGINFVMADDSSSFATSGTHTSWYNVLIGDIIPVDGKPIGGSPYDEQVSFHVVPQIPGHEFTRSIPWQDVWMYAANRPWPKVGSTVVTKMSGEHPINRNKAQMVYWDLGPAGGRSVAWIHRWVGSGEFWRWKYHPDVTAHVIYFTARVPIPEDVVLVHRIREMLGDYFYAHIYALSTMEFADKFGANIRPVEIELEQILRTKADVDQAFIRQEYGAVSDSLASLLLDLEEVVRDAIRVKDKAMVWIFAIEWLAVSGTSMLSGAILWTLMVRRRFYREVEETRLKPMMEG